ncbi:hypothetical protein [Planctobacterium marinum]|uniref:hypothetical protein n=1 Tax=Planctobacterium marinum TaxID=1631968 RepID=UPI001E3A8AC8|nr:hypothetical protein [Planctobacterium marinum]MCC2603775.1 hypothetical protein [Planctobacterium marinum]
MSESNQYLPHGSYLLTAKDVEVSINAISTRVDGSHNPNAAVTYPATEARHIGDIINENGNLVVGGGNGSRPNPTNQFGVFVPAGSYQLTSIGIHVTIQALCKKIDGSWVRSVPVRYTAKDAAQLADISNIDGQLTLAEK